jgi:hypothetical protein
MTTMTEDHVAGVLDYLVARDGETIVSVASLARELYVSEYDLCSIAKSSTILQMVNTMDGAAITMRMH